jgi:putative MFS transporter
MAGLLALALIIDIMKPASLGFVTPGMRAEYGLSKQLVAWLPLAALTGTVVGSFVWGALADLYGRRAAILLSSVMFVGTSICGAMPGFWWNVGMCALMGAAAGGMLPVAYALLAEIMPTRHRGWSLVLVGGIGAVGGVLAASALSALLQPTYGWRIMWFLNMPTGLLLILLSPLLPESARFLQQMGRGAEARAMLARFGATTVTAAVPPLHHARVRDHLPPV